MSRTRQARLAQELRVLRELKTQLEKARQQGQKELPAWVQEDERFRLLLRQAEKQVNLPPSVQASRGASVHVLHGEISVCVLVCSQCADETDNPPEGAFFLFLLSQYSCPAGIKTRCFCSLQTREEQQQEKRVEKMMKAAAKDVHKIRGQSRKEVPEVQTFRYEKHRHHHRFIRGAV